MAEFSNPAFSASSYAAYRPSYPDRLYDTLLSYHKGPRHLCVDLGCGHGLVPRSLAPHFTNVRGTDPSAKMIAQAQSSTSAETYPNITYTETPAESLPSVATASADMVVAGQAAHWFDYPRLWPELSRVLRPGGTLAFWGYQDHVFVDYPAATKVLRHYGNGNGEHLLGPYWAQPGRSIVENLLRDIKPPAPGWGDIRRIEYLPTTQGPNTGDGEVLMQRRMTLGMVRDYVRTWSSYQAWQRAHPEGGGVRDVVEEMFEKMVEAEPSWVEKGEGWREIEVVIEWGSGVLLARKE